jgi:hypothetical protein
VGGGLRRVVHLAQPGGGDGPRRLLGGEHLGEQLRTGDEVAAQLGQQVAELGVATTHAEHGDPPSDGELRGGRSPAPAADATRRR